MDNEEILRIGGECPRANCIEVAGHAGPCSGDLIHLPAQVARLEAQNEAMAAALEWYGERIAIVAGHGKEGDETLKAVSYELTADGGTRAGRALSDAGKGMDAETAKVFVEGMVAEHEDRHPDGD